MDYPSRGRAKITEAYYRTPSTTDYNGLYRGRYVDFEAKQTQNRTSFPKYLVQNIRLNTFSVFRNRAGSVFFIVRFTSLMQTYLVDAGDLIAAHQQTQAKSIPVSWFEQNGILLKEGLYPRVDYLSAVDEKYAAYYMETPLKGDK